MPRILIIGDQHLDRSLPHHKITEEGLNDRYEFQRTLLEEVTRDFEYIVNLGDATNVKDIIDGQIQSDFINIFAEKKVVHVLGNHDWSGMKDQKSMVQNIAQLKSSYRVVETTETIRVGTITFVFASYYAPEDEIRQAVEQAVSGGGKTVVCGHWNFWNQVMGGKRLPMTWAREMADRGAYFVLGHIHPPAPIEDVGEYLGVMSPIKFGESQGGLLVVDTDGGTLERIPYPRGEEFCELSYGAQDTWAIKSGSIEDKYIKVTFDPTKFDADEVRNRMSEEFFGCRRLFVIPEEIEESQRSEIDLEEFEIRVSSDEDYVRIVAQEHGMNEEMIIEKHREIKEAAI